MEKNLTDINARMQAGNMNNSVCLVAPAGSGKTSELIKRYLLSLLTVDKPSQVYAITFTKKATRELTARVMDVLHRAKQGAPINNAYESAMREIALKVLARDEQKQWGILEAPAQLEIKTIDGLCAWIAALAKTQVKTNGNITSKPHKIYRNAARDLLDEYRANTGDTELSDAIKVMLSYLGNQFSLAEDMLIEMCSERDQWLPEVLEYQDADAIKTRIEKANWRALNIIYAEVLSAVQQHEHQIIPLLHYASANKPDAYPEVSQSKLEYLPHNLCSEHDVAIMKDVFALLFTKDGLRKRLTVSNGFPPAKEALDKEVAIQMKRDIDDLLMSLDASGLGEHAKLAHKMVSAKFGLSEWRFMEALIKILPSLAARLHLAFARDHSADFVAVSAAANAALGEVDAPSDLALFLDNHIKHILIDEFQDTSRLQVSILSKLTASWLPGDGRTLFLVGDPMQSIYQFRMAEVSLFIDIAKNGIGHIKPELLRLTHNFRSQAKLVELNNQMYDAVFGSVDDLNLGTMPYTPSHPSKPATAEPLCCTFYERGQHTAQAKGMVSQIGAVLEMEPTATIGVLGKSRSDLEPILTELHHQQIAHQAVNVLKLSEQNCIYDLTAITRAVLNTRDQTAWFALLRTPMIGMSAEQMLSLTKFHQKRYNKSRHFDVFACLKDKDYQETLDKETLVRVSRLVGIIGRQWNKMAMAPLDKVIQAIYNELGGLSAVDAPSDIDMVNTYLTLLKEYSAQTFNWSDFKQDLEELYIQRVEKKGNIQVMTIHAAKGLEFDYVFIPNAEKTLVGNSAKLIDIQNFDVNGKDIVAMAPTPEVGLKDSNMNRIIRTYKQKRLEKEFVRLAYVATTRAKKALYVSALANPMKGCEQFNATSLMGIIRSQLSTPLACETISQSPPVIAQNTATTYRRLAYTPRRPIPHGKALASDRGLADVNNAVLPSPKGETRGAWIGSVVHLVIEMLTRTPTLSLEQKDILQSKSRWAQMLKQVGCPSILVPALMPELIKELTQIAVCPELAWLIQPRESLEIEKCVLYKDNNKLKESRIDLTFIEGNTRFIIDFKTSKLAEGETDSAFISRMLRTYHEKMRHYGTLFNDTKNIRVGLYLSAIGQTVLFADQHQQAA